jgi:hypothetical protein
VTVYRENSTSAQSLIDQEVLPKGGEQFSSGQCSALLQAAIETGLIIVGLMFVILLLPRQIGGDGTFRYNDLVSFLSTHNLYQPNSRYSLIGPLFSSPLLWIGIQLHDPVEWANLYNWTLFSLCLLVSYCLLRNHVDRALLRKFFLILIYGSMFVAHLAFYFGEVFTALFVGFGVFIALRRFIGIAGWLAVALGVVNTPATMVGLGLLVLKRTVDSKRLRYILVFAFATVCVLTEYQLRRGSIFNNGYIGTHGFRTLMPYSGLPDFSYPFFFGVLSIVLSFGQGLLFYAPGLLLPIRKTLSNWPQDQKINLYQVYTLWICFVVGLILVYARWWDWSGWVFWGPRYFLFASIPASFALAVRLIRYKEASLGINLLTFVVFCLSAWVSVDGAVFQLQVMHPLVCIMNHHAYDALCSYTPEYSPLWMPFVFHLWVSPAQVLFLVFSLLVAAYLVAPLFIHLLKQIWDLAKAYGRSYMKLSLWRI